ncbi:hypothetical protein [Streptomyces sp900116325]|uniref:hypothetical protein n=1 Tax=Streptomyces sp. 900116325 TaxID=3154295 RepID=UPI0033A22DE9
MRIHEVEPAVVFVEKGGRRREALFVRLQIRPVLGVSRGPASALGQGEQQARADTSVGMCPAPRGGGRITGL